MSTIEPTIDMETLELAREIQATEGISLQEALRLARARLLQLLRYAWEWDTQTA